MLGRRTFSTGLASTLLLAACGQSGIVTPTAAQPVAALPSAGTPATPAIPTSVGSPTASPSPIAGSPVSTIPTTTAQPSRLIYGADATIWQLDLRTGVETRLSPLTNRVGTPALSPDGQRLVYNAMVWPQEPHTESIRQQLWLHTLATDQHEVALDDAPPETRRGEIAWTPDGRTLLYEFYEEPSQRLSIRALDLATGQTRLLIESASQPSCSQTGQLAYLTHDYRSKPALWIADGDGRNARQIVPHSANYAMHSPRLSPDGQRVVFSALQPEKTSSQRASQQSSVVADFQRVAAGQQTSLPNYDLWIAMTDGSGVRGYGVAPSYEIGPNELQCNWYPDGQQIIFASYKGIFRLPLFGSNQPTRIGAASQATGLYLTT